MARQRQPLCPTCKINLKAPGQGYCGDCRKRKQQHEQENKVKSLRTLKPYLKQPGPEPLKVEVPVEIVTAKGEDLVRSSFCSLAPGCPCIACRVIRGEIPQDVAERLRCRPHGVVGCDQPRCQIASAVPA